LRFGKKRGTGNNVTPKDKNPTAREEQRNVQNPPWGSKKAMKLNLYENQKVEGCQNDNPNKGKKKERNAKTVRRKKRGRKGGKEKKGKKKEKSPLNRGKKNQAQPKQVELTNLKKKYGRDSYGEACAKSENPMGGGRARQR